MDHTVSEILNWATETLDIELNAISALRARLDASFVQALKLILACQGKVVVTGMGKSGHIGRKIAASLASTGTPAFFVHPAEASHGDLGMIARHDLVLALSNSGETPELLCLLPHLEHQCVPLISFSRPNSHLARSAQVNLDVSVQLEACPHNLAPTASTTAALVMGDALTVAVLKARGFSREAFALSHPGGQLGKRLWVRVRDLMHSGQDLPWVQDDWTIAQCLPEVTSKRLGVALVRDSTNPANLLGVFTDGDLRRAVDLKTDLHATPIAALMVRQFKSVDPDSLAFEALGLFETHQITTLPVLDHAHKVLGLLHIHDLFKAGLT